MVSFPGFTHLGCRIMLFSKLQGTIVVQFRPEGNFVDLCGNRGHQKIVMFANDLE